MSIRGLLLDLDGTLFVGETLLPGALDALAEIESLGLPTLFATNMTRRPRRALLEKLAKMGWNPPAEAIYTAPLAAAAWLRREGVHRVLACMARATLEDLPGFELVDPRDARSSIPTPAPSSSAPHASRPGPAGAGSLQPVDAVLIGDLGDEWSYPILNSAFRHLLAGARLVAVQRNLYWRDDDGLSLDAGPFVLALEAAAGVEATVVGKPSAEFFRGAADLLGVPLSDVVMVGDDVTSDVGGAQAAGARGVLVRTGKFRESDLHRGVEPDAVIASVAELPEWLRTQ